MLEVVFLLRNVMLSPATLSFRAFFATRICNSSSMRTQGSRFNRNLAGDPTLSSNALLGSADSVAYRTSRQLQTTSTSRELIWSFVQRANSELGFVALSRLQTLFGPYLIRFCASFWTSDSLVASLCSAPADISVLSGQVLYYFVDADKETQRARRDGGESVSWSALCIGQLPTLRFCKGCFDKTVCTTSSLIHLWISVKQVDKPEFKPPSRIASEQRNKGAIENSYL